MTKPSTHLALPTYKFCGGMRPTPEKGKFVKYGPKHYAHMACFVDASKSPTLLRPKQQRELARWLSKRGTGEG